MKSVQNPGKALAEECYQYLAWVTGAVEKFPRSHKFLLGDKIHAMSIELLMLIVQATYTRDRASLLRRAQIFLEQLRFLFRLCFDARLVSESGYEHAARQLNAIGRGIGGWQKAHDAQATQRALAPDRDLLRAAPGSETRDPRET